MSAKSFPSPNIDSTPSHRGSTWSTAGHDMLARLGLVSDRSVDHDPREGLSELALKGDSPERPLEPKGLDAGWATRRIL